MVQTSFLFYGGITTAFLTYFAIHFNVFDGTLGRSLVGNLSFIGFTQLPGGNILYWAYQILAVAMLAAASMTAFQDLQATAWRDVAIGEIPEIVVYRNPQGTFTRSVTAGFIVAILIQFAGEWQYQCSCPLLWHRSFHAHHGDGICHPPAYSKDISKRSKNDPGEHWGQDLLQFFLGSSLLVRLSESGLKAAGWF